MVIGVLELSGVKGSFDGEAAALDLRRALRQAQDKGVDHGGFHILVAEKFLDSANIVATWKEAVGLFGADEVGGEFYFLEENVAIEEEDGAEGLTSTDSVQGFWVEAATLPSVARWVM